MRLFIAINFTESVNNELYSILLSLKKESLSGNFSSKNNLHLTLAFLGEVSRDEVKSIIKAMKSSVAEPFTLTITDFGKFNSRDESLYWYGVKASEALTSLQRKLMQELKREQLSPDEKAFKPHITLARRCKMKEGFTESTFRDKLKNIEIQVNKISLMESERINGKLVYTEIAAVDL